MLTILLAAATPIVTTVPKACTPPVPLPATNREPVRARRLNEMPPGKQVLGVYNSVNGCPQPIVVREEVGQPRR